MRKFLTLLVAVFLVVLIPVSLYAFNLQQNLLRPDVYREALASDQVYQALIDFLGNAAASRAEDEGTSISAADLEELQSLAVEALPRDWFTSQVEANVDAIFRWLDSDRPLPDLALDLQEVKPHLIPLFRHVVLRQWEALPPCPGDGLPTLDEEGNPLCRPPGMSQKRFLSLAGVSLDREIAQGLREVPDRLTLAELQDQAGEGSPQELETALQQIRVLVNALRLGSLILLGATALAVVILVLLAGTSAPSLLGWTGGTLVAGGLTSAIPALAAPTLLDRVLGTMTRGGGAEGRVAVELIQSTLAPLAEAVTASIISQSLVVAAIGGVALAAGVVLWLMPRSAASAPSPTGEAEPEQAS